MKHIPVLLNEVIEVMQPKSEGQYIDATVGDGGHAQALLDASTPGGTLLGIDQDMRQVAVAQERLTSYGSRARVVVARFSQLSDIAQAEGFDQVDGILFDLGISSRQLDDTETGLSFADSAPLTMQLHDGEGRSAADILNRANEREIADILFDYGDRHNSRTLARKIVEFRRKRAFHVARDVKEALGVTAPHMLAPIFQAFRIAVNEEFEEIESALPQAISLLKPGGVLAVITFHSGEDRIVKRFLKGHALLQVSKKIIRPTWPEIKQNSRARSAILRFAIKEKN